MLDFNPDGKKVILSIDGGGMRGTISIAMLAELEQMTGKPAYELFDMFAGTSTGAIISAGLAIGLSAEKILETIYKDRLPKAFPPRNTQFWVRYLLGGARHLYNIEPFANALVPLVSGIKVGDIQRKIVFMTAKDMRSGDTLYIVNRGPGAVLSADWPVSGAVAASGAAPIFFPPVAGNLVDGGVGVYGNPSLAAVTEALEYIGAAEGFVDQHVMLISLGTGYVPNITADKAANRFWLADWLPYVILETLDDTALQQVFVTRAIYGSRIDFRRYNPLLTRASVTGPLGLTLPAGVEPSHLGLDSFAPAEVTLMEQIGRAYARLIDWTQPSVMPWMTPGGHPKPDALKYPVDWTGTPFA